MRLALCLLAVIATQPAFAGGQKLPEHGDVLVDTDRGEVILSAKIQIPKDKECIDKYGERIQAFAGSSRAEGESAKMTEYFVFLADTPIEDIHRGMMKLGCRPKVHLSMEEGRKRAGWKSAEFLQGDPVAVSIFWKQDDRWIEKPYQSFVTERVMIDGKAVEKPWTPHFVYHGSGAIHKAKTGCLACPCDCPGGLIADNRNPIYEPKPQVRFDTGKLPPEGTQVYIRLRPSVSKE